MTAKEKAKDLYIKHYNATKHLHNAIRKNTVLQSCIITVDEIILQLSAIPHIPLLIGYWQEVKSEIEKI